MSNYVPDRNHIIAIDFDPAIGEEIGKYRPALVLSKKAQNEKSGLLICCPVSTSIRGGSAEIPVNNLEKRCVVVSNLVQTLDWRGRHAKYLTDAEQTVLDVVTAKLITFIGGGELMKKFIESEVSKRLNRE